MIPHLQRQLLNKKDVDLIIDYCAKFWNDEIDSFDNVTFYICQFNEMYNQYEYIGDFIKDIVKYNYLMYKEIHKETIYLALMVFGFNVVEMEREDQLNGDYNEQE